ncbi:uncharacterized protein LOC111891814 isoform X2 [Lactuca sativa]|uniref:uncharacterized protein LOC111891814 isoform X2 n=1 Tax=Lactuca sativa TaxID=4236 RepID=UPI000CD9CB42|nr:uncharacterized protein LOC111891814 isoform X2 [Lactuca sativa]
MESCNRTRSCSGERRMELVREVIRKEVQDWDSEVMISARFKAFSGQRSDWEPRYHFWRDLVIKIARRLRIFIIRPSVVKNVWFNQGGLTPLCIDDVLLEMYNAGDLSCSNDLIDPKGGQLTQLFHKVRHLLPLSKSAIPSEDEFIVSSLLEEKCIEVVKLLCDCHWTSSCIITMARFQVICEGPKEASVILSHFSKCGKAKYLAIRRQDLIEGVKVSLSPKTVPGIIPPDYEVLHLTWTAEKLQLQIDLIDQRCVKSKMSALASLKSGNKSSAMRHARELKLASESREKCHVLLMRVEEVLRAIADAQDSKEVFEAIQSGTKAIKDNKVTIEEVQLCLDELDGAMNSQRQVDEVIGSVSSYAEFDEDIEDELDKLQLEESRKSSHSHAPPDDTIRREHTTESLSNALSDLKLSNEVVMTKSQNVSKFLDPALS